MDFSDGNVAKTLADCLERLKEWNFDVWRKLLVAVIGEDFVIPCYYYIVLSSIIS